MWVFWIGAINAKVPMITGIINMKAPHSIEELRSNRAVNMLYSLAQRFTKYRFYKRVERNKKLKNSNNVMP